MGHIKFDKGTSKKRGLLGFYLALAVCLVAIGGVAVTTFLNSDNPPQGDTNTSTTSTAAPASRVENIITNIPDTRTVTTQTTSSQTTAKSVQATTAKSGDLFVLPLTNEVLRSFSNNQPLYNATMRDWRVHNGVDFKGTAGQKVKAIADGTISSIETDTMWGNVVVIDHGSNTVSRYCGTTALSSLKKGDTVKVGDAIGTLSDVPCETDDGPHLHLEIAVNSNYVDPVKAIGRDVKAAAATAAPATTTGTAAVTTTPTDTK